MGPNTVECVPRQKSVSEQQRHALLPQPPRADRHDADLSDLHPAGDDALSMRSASVPDAPENRKNGAMNSAPATITSEAAHARLRAPAEGDQDRQRALQQVVVEGAQKLRDEERREPSRRQQLTRVAIAWTSPLSRRVTAFRPR